MADPVEGAAGAAAAGATPDSTPPKDPTAGGTGTGTAGDPNATAKGAGGEGDTLLTETPAADAKAPAKPEGDEKKGDKPQGAPESYTDFKVPEGVTLDAEASKQFAVVAKELGLTQEGAQKLVDLQAQMASSQHEAAVAQFTKVREDWKQETLKALGSEKDAKLAFAAKAREKFGSTELVTLMNESGLGNHPAVVKLFVDIGKAISEDNFAEGSSAVGDKTLAERIYGSGSKSK